jgi:hypothetical protein
MNHRLAPVFLATIGLGLVYATVARCAEAPRDVPRLRMPDPLLSLRDMYPDIADHAAGDSVNASFPSRNAQPQATAVDAPARRAELPLTNAWQRMAEARTPGGVRLLTLWRAAAGSVALHAGKHGGPSLQWTSSASVHGSSPRGLFDHLVATGGQSAH